MLLFFQLIKLRSKNINTEKLIKLSKMHEKAELVKEDKLMAAHLISEGYIVIPPECQGKEKCDTIK